MICLKAKFKDLKHPYQKSTVFQVIQGFEKTVMYFQYFKALHGPI